MVYTHVVGLWGLCDYSTVSVGVHWGGGGGGTRGLCTLGHTVSACCVSSFIICCNCSISVDDAKQDNHSMGAEPRKVWSSRENLIAEISTLRVCMLPWKLKCHPHLTSHCIPFPPPGPGQPPTATEPRAATKEHVSKRIGTYFGHLQPLCQSIATATTQLRGGTPTVAKMMSTLQSHERGVLVMRITD